MSTFTVKATIATFGGRLYKLSHTSASTGTPMNVNVFLPPQTIAAPKKVPVLYYLSGLTCSPENCSEKGFLQAAAARHGIAIVYPDTSPRGLQLAAEHESWDFGEAASFYLDATTDGYSSHYRMESYLTKELPEALFGSEQFGAHLDQDRQSITGHSMGGHGALTLYLRHPGRYRSVSAFAPISNPTRCPWGQKAFRGYLGPADVEITPESATDATIPAAWKEHDATELVKKWKGDLKMLIDVGTGDNFYKQKQLLPENLEKAVKDAGLAGLTVRYQDAYDHSYYFISSFGQDHVDHAAKYLLPQERL